MAASLKLLPGSTVRWRGRRYLIVDYESLDAIIARQPGKRRLERIPVNEAAPDHASHIVSAWPTVGFRPTTSTLESRGLLWVRHEHCRE
jgi:hypothetical protein